MNQPPKRRRVPVHGVLLLDKPVGMSSTQSLAKVKWLLNAEKAGHTGTLDPFATGLLPLCFGEATKFAQDLLEADKTYEATVHLGLRTSTGDTEGELLETRPVAVSLAEVEAVLQTFRGPIRQVPPMYSALKRDGKPLYEYARAGVTLEREARDVNIHHLELLAFSPPELKIRVSCSKGTYIRVLGEDIGQALGCGAHLTALRRTGVGTLDLQRSLTLETFTALDDAARRQALLPVDALLVGLPPVSLDEGLARRFLQGQRIPGIPEIPEPDVATSATSATRAAPADPALVRVYRADDGQLLGVAQLDARGVLSPQRLVAVTPSS